MVILHEFQLILSIAANLLGFLEGLWAHGTSAT